MLPNLNHLSLHDVANTMGFYEPTEEEQAAMNDDPVTLEKPLHTMTFRVRLPDDGPNGEPSTSSFRRPSSGGGSRTTRCRRARAHLVRGLVGAVQHLQPRPPQRPGVGARLKRRSEYVAERAREQAAQAQQAARADAREAREGEPPAGVPAVAPVATTPCPAFGPARRAWARSGHRRASAVALLAQAHRRCRRRRRRVPTIE